MRLVASAGTHESRIDADLRGSCDAGERAYLRSASGRARALRGCERETGTRTSRRREAGRFARVPVSRSRHAGLQQLAAGVHDRWRSAHIRVSCSSPGRLARPCAAGAMRLRQRRGPHRAGPSDGRPRLREPVTPLCPISVTASLHASAAGARRNARAEDHGADDQYHRAMALG